jgi:hypothetical protein
MVIEKKDHHEMHQWRTFPATDAKVLAPPLLATHRNTFPSQHARKQANEQVDGEVSNKEPRNDCAERPAKRRLRQEFQLRCHF